MINEGKAGVPGVAEEAVIMAAAVVVGLAKTKMDVCRKD